MIVVHYCCASYEKGSTGGVARFDCQLRLAVPNRVFFQGPQQKLQLQTFLQQNPAALVVTDNHLSIDVPNTHFLILVHHGSALTHAARDPDWNVETKQLCCDGQRKMLMHRDPDKTLILSPSSFCTAEFSKYFTDIYDQFLKIHLPHASELDESCFRDFAQSKSKRMVLGNWPNKFKGEDIIDALRSSKKNTFNFVKLAVRFDEPLNITNFNKKKQAIYLQNDIFLQLSPSEGYSYSTVDAMLCGLAVVATDVGFFYSDVPSHCFVKIDWRKRNDQEYVLAKVEYAHRHCQQIGLDGRTWLLQHHCFQTWKKNISFLLNEMHKEIVEAQSLRTAMKKVLSDHHCVNNVDCGRKNVKKREKLLILPFFTSNEISRQQELNYCLQKNVESKLFDKIILQVEQNFVGSFDSEQIEIEYKKTGGRQTFADVIQLANQICASQPEKQIVCCIANCDIFFDHTIEPLFKSIDETTAFAITRWDQKKSAENGQITKELHINGHWSQDVWIFCGNIRIPTFELQFQFGVPGCDNRFAYLIHKYGYKLCNPALDVVCTHVQESEKRNYNNSQRIKHPYLFVQPKKIADVQNYGRETFRFDARGKILR